MWRAAAAAVHQANAPQGGVQRCVACTLLHACVAGSLSREMRAVVVRARFFKDPARRGAFWVLLLLLV